jgi:hypothetical protein
LLAEFTADSFRRRCVRSARFSPSGPFVVALIDQNIFVLRAGDLGRTHFFAVTFADFSQSYHSGDEDQTQAMELARNGESVAVLWRLKQAIDVDLYSRVIRSENLQAGNT